MTEQPTDEQPIDRLTDRLTDREVTLPLCGYNKSGQEVSEGVSGYVAHRDAPAYKINN